MTSTERRDAGRARLQAKLTAGEEFTCPSCGGPKFADADIRGPIAFVHRLDCAWANAEDARLVTDYEMLRYSLRGVLTRSPTPAEVAFLTAVGRPPVLHDPPQKGDTVAVVSFYSPGIRQRRFPDLYPELES